MKQKLTIEISKEELDSIRKELTSECSKFGDKKCNYVLSGNRRPNECFGCKNEWKEMICKCLNQIAIDENRTSDSCSGCVYENYDNDYYKDNYNLIKEWFGYSVKGDTDEQNDEEKVFDEIKIIITEALSVQK